MVRQESGPHGGSAPALEALEPRLLLSGQTAGLAATLYVGAGADATARFWWSGYAAQAPAEAGLTDPAGATDRAGTQAVIDYLFPDVPTLTEAAASYTVDLAGEGAWHETGEPIMPVRDSKILLPPGEQIVSADVELGEGILLAEGVELAAAAEPLPLGDRTDLDDQAAATATGAFPADQPVTVTTQRLLGYDIAVVRVFPVQYDPAGGVVTFYPSVRVTITTAPALAAKGIAPRQDPTDLERVLNVVDNDTAAAAYVAVSSAEPASENPRLGEAGPYEYVVVTSPELAGAFQRLVDHKRARGVSATVVTTDLIEQTYTSPYVGEDDAAGRIRAFLSDAFAHWQTGYVLLGGDVSHVPARQVYVQNGAYSATAASDVYYACLDGPYNATPDDRWGQDNDGTDGGEVDLLPELAVGRAPVDTPAEAETFIDKTILYETTPPPNALQSVLIGEELTRAPQTWGGDSCDYIAATTFPAEAETATLYERDGTYRSEVVRDALNASPHFVNHLGHSTSIEDAGLYADDIDALTNEHPYVYYSQGCKPGQFEKEDAVGEHLLYSAGGAVAAVLNTHYGWYEAGDTTGSGTQWALAFWDAIFTEGILAFGDAHMDAKIDRVATIGSADSDRWLFFVSTLFGDPETPFHLLVGSTPAGTGDTYEVPQAEPLEVGPDAGVLANDVDPDGSPQPLTAELMDPARHGQLTLHADGSFVYAPEPTWSGPDSFTYRPFDGLEYGEVTTAALEVLPRPTVLQRCVFYDHSTFDDPLRGGTDDDAIAPDKQPLLPGQRAGFANYTSYVHGINGVMIDVAHLPAGTLTDDDVQLRVGNSDDTGTWASCPETPIVTVRRGAGIAGSDRITLALPDGAVVNQWLQVALRATESTGLATDDVFYFGNAVADCGDSPTDTWVTEGDEAAARSNATSFFRPAGPDNRYDYNRDGRVDGFDQALARNQPTASGNCLRLITASGEAPTDPACVAAEPALPESTRTAGDAPDQSTAQPPVVAARTPPLSAGVPAGAGPSPLPTPQAQTAGGRETHRPADAATLDVLDLVDTLRLPLG